MQANFNGDRMENEKPQTTKTPETSYSHIMRYTGVFGGVQGLKTFVSMVRNKLTTHLLGSVGFGLISVYNTISEFIVSCSNFGLPLNATRVTSELYEAGSREDISHLVCVIRTWALWTAVFASLVCLLLSPLLSYFFFDYDYSRYGEVLLKWLRNMFTKVTCFMLKARFVAVNMMTKTVCIVHVLKFMWTIWSYFHQRVILNNRVLLHRSRLLRNRRTRLQATACLFKRQMFN